MGDRDLEGRIEILGVLGRASVRPMFRIVLTEKGAPPTWTPRPPG